MTWTRVGNDPALVEQPIAPKPEPYNLLQWLKVGNLHEEAPAEPPPGRYKHVQTSPASTWVIEHHLGLRPDVSLFLSANPSERVYTELTYPNDDTILVEWDKPTTGSAHI